MEIRVEHPPEYGPRAFFQEISSTIDEKNPLIDQILGVLTEKNFVDEDEEIWARICFDEVLTNAIRHGNKENPSKKVKVSLFTDEKQWAIRVEDEGEGFSVEDIPDPDDESSLELEHGRGILLIKEYMDEIWYYDNGSSVQLKKEKKSRLRKFIDKILTMLRLK